MSEKVEMCTRKNDPSKNICGQNWENVGQYQNVGGFMPEAKNMLGEQPIQRTEKQIRPKTYWAKNILQEKKVKCVTEYQNEGEEPRANPCNDPWCFHPRKIVNKF